jgi:hypothetical protein
MKAINKTFILFFLFNAFLFTAPQKISAQVSVNFRVFYDNLSPYGYWVDNPDYGYAWIPDVPSDFTPYHTNGYWTYTNLGWTWVSYYSWGWAPFHYGRWLFDSYYGWMWVPGDEWAPAWVTWRRSESYYGWAPIGPGISITIAFSNRYRLPYNQWTFVRDRDFGRRDINNYYINRSSNTTIINNSTVINNIRTDNTSRARYNAGPDRNEVQRRSTARIVPVAVKERNRPGQNLSNGELQIYKPRVQKNNVGGQKPVPTKVMRLKDVKPAAQRNSKTQPQRENQRTKQQLAPQQRKAQPAKQPQTQQRNIPQAQQQQAQHQRNVQQAKEQQAQQQRNVQQAKEQQAQQQRNVQQAKEQQAQQQRNVQQGQQQKAQQQSNNQQPKQQPVKQKRNNQQDK